MARADPPRAGLTIRCAIYTRKSSDEGLEQEFNSLDAQREACEAYIASQRHAGWVALSDMYDDGGLSGGSMERPALKRLLEDITAGKVQIIVVYKVDRLTRSLADFAKIVDILDAHKYSQPRLPCQLPPLPRHLSKRGFYIRIARLRSQTLTFFRLIKVSLDTRIQAAVLRFLKASCTSTISVTVDSIKNPLRLHLERV
jgi:hypothetical protein